MNKLPNFKAKQHQKSKIIEQQKVGNSGPRIPDGRGGPDSPFRPGDPGRPGGPGDPGGPVFMPVPGVDYPLTHATPQYIDLVYATVSPSQKLDIYLPKGSKPYPLMILVHGGGFRLGDKADQLSLAGTDLLLDRGYAVAVFNFRLSDEAKAPAQVRDVKTAMRWLRAHAHEYHLNPDKFGVWGASSGGNLAALLGTSCGVAELEGAEMGHADQSSCVQAVVDWFGPIDFLQMDQQFKGTPNTANHNDANSFESIYIGAPIQTRPDLVKVVNPITYITSNASPFLIEHGSEDHLVPWQQSQLLYDALKPAIGDKVTFTLLKDTGHGGGDKFWDSTNIERLFYFLDQYLK